MDQFEIAKRMNMAENGRLFVCGLFFINLLTGHPLLAFLALLSVAAAIFVDMIPTFAPLAVRNGASLSVYVYTAAIAFLSFVNLW